MSDLKQLLAVSDVVSLHVPLNAETKGMVDQGFLAQMKRGASLVNTARGSLVADEELVLKSLAEGQLASVGFDVLPQEPPEDSPIFRAWQIGEPDFAGKICITPHVAFHSVEASDQVTRQSAEEAQRMLSGVPLRNPVI